MQWNNGFLCILRNLGYFETIALFQKMLFQLVKKETTSLRDKFHTGNAMFCFLSLVKITAIISSVREIVIDHFLFVYEISYEWMNE